MLMCYHLGQDAVVDLDLDQSSMQVDGSTPLHACARPTLMRTYTHKRND